MSGERFEHLHFLVKSLINPLSANPTNGQTHSNNSKFRKSIPTRERLVITLRYFSSGCSQQNLSFNFLISRTAVLRFLAKTSCNAVYKGPSPIYLRPRNTKEEWKEISAQYIEIWIMTHVI